MEERGHWVPADSLNLAHFSKIKFQITKNIISIQRAEVADKEYYQSYNVNFYVQNIAKAIYRMSQND